MIRVVVGGRFTIARTTLHYNLRRRSGNFTNRAQGDLPSLTGRDAAALFDRPGRLRLAGWLALAPALVLLGAGFWFLWAQFPPERAVWLGVVLPFAVAMGLGLVLFGAAALRGRGPAAVACTAAAALAVFVLVEQGMITRAPLLNPWPAIAAAAAPHLTTSDRLVLVGRAADGYNFANFYLDEPVVGVHAGADLEALWQRERVLAVVPAEDRDALIQGLTPAAAVLHVSPARLVLIANWNPSAR